VRAAEQPSLSTLVEHEVVRHDLLAQNVVGIPSLPVLLDAERDNLQTATNPGARWLFPGRRAGQPLHASTLGALVRDLGIPARAGRPAALRQLVLQAPAPVVAQALGYNHSTTARIATEAGTPWSRYASGDHSPGHQPE
jgi:hypothetical protein